MKTKQSVPSVKPGQSVPDSGIYRSGDRRATMVRGEPAPPTPGKGMQWRQVVDTNRKKPWSTSGSPAMVAWRARLCRVA